MRQEKWSGLGYLPAGFEVMASFNLTLRLETILIKKFAAASTLLLLSGCALTLPVTGQLSDGSETFIGDATGQLDGVGTLKITSSKGTKCSGDFVYVTERKGEGTFTCNDGRSGPFSFVSTGTRGTGTGQLAGQLFTFKFG